MHYMEIKWYGHSCFLITNEAGIRVLTDPPHPQVGYAIPPVACEAVTSSHAHHDHNFFSIAAGSPVIIAEPGDYRVGEIRITGVPTFHDDVQGAKRGRNIVFVFETDGMRVVHAGDIGALPDEATLAQIGPADVLLVPVGGVYTIDAAGARQLANLLKPKVVIPMHYKTDAIAFELDGIAPFLNSVKNCAIHRLRQSDCVLTKESLGSDRVITLDYAREGT